MTGYDKYLKALENKVKRIYHLEILSPDDLEHLKHWFNDHNEGDDIGGVAVFSTELVYSHDLEKLPEGTEEAGKVMIIDVLADTTASGEFKSHGHRMTFVGYNDSIKYDFNGDGQYTDTVDINGDGIVNMADWEHGALKIAGSGGENWLYVNDSVLFSNRGYLYFPYRLIAQEQNFGHYTIRDRTVNMIDVKVNATPKVYMKAKLKSDDRSKIITQFSTSNDTANINANQAKTIRFNQAGHFPVQGINEEPIEMVFDYSDKLGNSFLKHFIYRITTNNFSLSDEKTIEELVVIDNDGIYNEFYILENSTPIPLFYSAPINSIFYDYTPSSIENNLTIDKDFNINKHVTVSNGSVFTLTGNSLISLIEGGEITVEPGSKLVIGTDVILEGAANGNVITVNGELEIQSGATIRNLTVNRQGGLVVKNKVNTTIDNVTFDNSKVEIESSDANVTIRNSTFLNSPIDALCDGTSAGGFFTFTDNQVKNAYTTGLRISDYPMYQITNNTFEGNSGHGLALYNCGNTSYRDRLISNNVVFNNSDGYEAKGVLLYATVADILDNRVFENDFGFAFYHKSIISMEGDPEKHSQEIFSNTVNQILTTDNSFPWHFEANVIIEENNTNPRIVSLNNKPRVLNIENNCWGDKFDPATDLYPPQIFDYLPVWDCGLNLDDLLPSMPKELYMSALNNASNTNYLEAETELKQIVNDYPSSEYAASAMKVMPAVAFQLKTLTDLIDYYSNNATINSDEELQKLAGYLKADCFIYLKDYQSALNFYESIMSNPPTPEDYTFAQIDAGRVQQLMEADGGKANVSFKYQNLMPKTRAEYKTTRKELLGEIKSEQIIDAEEANSALEDAIVSDFNIYPNPVNNTLNVTYKLSEVTPLTIEIYNAVGQLVLSSTGKLGYIGTQNVELNTSDIDNGVYFIKVSANNQSLETKQIVIAH